MIGHRDGAVVTVCDGCYRTRRSGEPGWYRAPEGGLPESTARPSPTRGEPVPAMVVQPAQPLDYCEECAAERGAIGYNDGYTDGVG